MTIDNNVFSLSSAPRLAGNKTILGWDYSITRFDGRVLTGWVAEGRLEQSLKRIAEAINHYQSRMQEQENLK